MSPTVAGGLPYVDGRARDNQSVGKQASELVDVRNATAPAFARVGQARRTSATRRCSPACRGGFSTRRRRSDASAPRSPSRPDSPRPQASSTTPAPSAPSLPGMTCHAGLTQGTWPSWSASTDSVRLRPSRSCMILSSPSREGHSSCDVACRSSSSFPFAARHARSGAGPDGPSRRRQLPSGTSSVVHRQQPRFRPVGHRGLHWPACRRQDGGARFQLTGKPVEVVG
jgi:hypothetical protein